MAKTKNPKNADKFITKLGDLIIVSKGDLRSPTLGEMLKRQRARKDQKAG